MEVAKSLFKGSRPHEGYSGREDYNDVVETALSDDDDGDSSVTGERRLKPTPGGPFSAVHPSMWPQDVLKKLGSNPSNLEPRYDEFGFLIDEDGMFIVVGRSPKHVYKPVVEDPQDRLKWLATLEFSSKDGSTDLSWEGVPSVIPKTDKLREMVRGGIPHSLRSQLYVRFSGALSKKKSSKLSYSDMVAHSADDQELSSKDIEKDLLRSMPGNYFFKTISSPGIPRLRRVLRALAYLYPSIGYCQGMSLFCANLLLIMDEEDSFWMMSAIIEDLLPPGYFTKSLEEFESDNSHGKSSISTQFFVDISGVHIDASVMETLAKRHLPEMMTILEAYDVDVKLTLFPWFSTIYATCFRHVRFTYRIWDMLFFDGSVVLFQLALGLLKKCEPSVDSAVDTSMIFTRLSNITYEIEDIDDLIREAVEVGGSVMQPTVESLRQQKKQCKMVSDDGWTSEAKVSRRALKRSKSVIEMILFGDELTEEDVKLKNIRQTEILVELREAIKQVVRHFVTTESNLYNESSLAVDYGVESHSRDLDRYMNVSRNRCRRAKALLDFERNDDDELGFRKNDIITIISQKDEDCWVGELNGLRGWFPAKFVKMLDERSKKYSCAGDDSVSEAITDLVRGTLCPAIKQVLEHGMKRPHFLGGPCHPWLFIEEAATREVEKDFRSVYSRLVLCKTYRLDEDGKVLTPEELLYRCIQAVNLSHDSAHAQMDIKLRSLVCIGLNEQVLHLWLEVLCSSIETVNKWYHHWSFINSPGWVQVKCELRLLANFSFNLNPEWELRSHRSGDSSKVNEPHLKDGVRDMLVKHHLFSWDL